MTEPQAKLADAEVVTAIRAIARKNLPLGEIAERLQMPLEEVRTIADLNGIPLVRDNRTGSSRTILAHKVAASAYVAKLREGFVAKQHHTRRLAQAAPLTPAQEAEAIARFIQTKGVTRCPTVHLEASDEMVRASVSGQRPSKRHA